MYVKYHFHHLAEFEYDFLKMPLGRLKMWSQIQPKMCFFVDDSYLTKSKLKAFNLRHTLGKFKELEKTFFFYLGYFYSSECVNGIMFFFGNLSYYPFQMKNETYQRVGGSIPDSYDSSCSTCPYERYSIPNYLWWILHLWLRVWIGNCRHAVRCFV